MRVSKVRFVESVQVNGLRGEHPLLDDTQASLEVIDGCIHIDVDGKTTVVMSGNIRWVWKKPEEQISSKEEGGRKRPAKAPRGSEATPAGR